MSNAVKVEKLAKVFEFNKGRGFSKTRVETTAVDRISFEVPEGQSLAFIGPNGAGKSTTIKMLTGILRPTSGEAEVLSLVPWRQRNKLSRLIGAVFGQRSQLWYHLPPRDTFELLSRIYELDRSQYLRRSDMLIERFALASFLDTPVRKLSLGQRMRAEVAASLLHQPRIVFLDEPTIGLDVVARQELRDVIREWNREEGVTIFLTSHDAGDIESVSRRVIVINHGRIVLDDKISNMRRRYLSSKVLNIKFHDEHSEVAVNGVTVLKSTGYALKLEVDCQVVGMEEVLHHVVNAGSVADITIEDPPLEEVIAHIYGQAGSSEAAENVEVS